MAAAGKKPHVLAVAVPAQGHLKPLMSLCRHLAQHDIKVTFVNAQSIHHKLLSAAKTPMEEHSIALTSVPDGLKPDDDDDDPFVLFRTLPTTMPATLLDLIERINCSNPNQKISCVIADLSFGWALDIAEYMGAEAVGFSPPSVASFAILNHIPKLIEQGNLDINGTIISHAPSFFNSSIFFLKFLKLNYIHINCRITKES